MDNFVYSANELRRAGERRVKRRLHLDYSTTDVEEEVQKKAKANGAAAAAAGLLRLSTYNRCVCVVDLGRNIRVNGGSEEVRVNSHV